MCQEPVQKVSDQHSLHPSLQRRLNSPVAGCKCDDNSIFINNNSHHLSVFLVWQALVKGSLQIFLIKALRNLRRDAAVVPI